MSSSLFYSNPDLNRYQLIAQESCRMLVTTDDNFGRASQELECFISQHKDEINSVLESRISAAHFPSRLQARYHRFATWEIVSCPDPAAKHGPGQAREEVVLDLFFNSGFGASGSYKQLIIRRYRADGYPYAREVQRQKYIVLHDDKNPVDALQRALTDLPLD
ncbi:MAG: hypothetical protein WA821_03460 [Anaerolineales bacterium]